MKRATIAKAVLLVAALVGAAMYVRSSSSEQATAREFNRIVTQLVNEQKYPEAATALEKLLPTAPESMRPRVREELARCYLHLGENPELALKESARFFKKAHDLAPATLSPAQVKTLRLVEPERP